MPLPQRRPRTIPITTADIPISARACNIRHILHLLSCGHFVAPTNPAGCGTNCFIPGDLAPFQCTVCVETQASDMLIDDIATDLLRRLYSQSTRFPLDIEREVREVREAMMAYNADVERELTPEHRKAVAIGVRWGSSPSFWLRKWLYAALKAVNEMPSESEDFQRLLLAVDTPAELHSKPEDLQELLLAKKAPAEEQFRELFEFHERGGHVSAEMMTRVVVVQILFH